MKKEIKSPKKRDRKSEEIKRLKLQIEDRDRRIAIYLKESEKPKNSEVKRYSAKVYCANCMHVNNVNIPLGQDIKGGDCVDCRVRGMLYPVIN